MDTTLKRTWAEIDLDSLAYNYTTIRSHLDPGVRFLGVVKADAYGHGAVQVGLTLQSLGADYLAVSSLDEARELRANGITMPVLVLGHTPPDQVALLIENNITQAVTCEAKALEYEAEAAKLGKRLRVHIKLDTGMSRLGFLCEGEHFAGGVAAVGRAVRLPHLDAEGVFTHFAVADEPGPDNESYTRRQFALFCRVIDAVLQDGFRFRIRHCANTGATVRWPEMQLDMVRPGLLLYGYGEFAAAWGLRPVMSLKSVIGTIKVYDPGTSISYGRLFTTQRRTTVGVLPIGYADGLFRSLSNRYSVLTAQGKAPILGKICMDMCMVDLTGLQGADVGDEVTVFGPGNPIEQAAECAGTIPYELTCAVSKRVPRIYLRGGKVVGSELRLNG